MYETLFRIFKYFSIFVHLFYPIIALKINVNTRAWIKRPFVVGQPFVLIIRTNFPNTFCTNLYAYGFAISRNSTVV